MRHGIGILWLSNGSSQTAKIEDDESHDAGDPAGNAPDVEQPSPCSSALSAVPTDASGAMVTPLRWMHAAFKTTVLDDVEWRQSEDLQQRANLRINHRETRVSRLTKLWVNR